MAGRFKLNQAGIDALVKDAIEKIGVPKMQRVADACNAELVQSALNRTSGKRATARFRSVKANIADIGKGFMVSVEGDNPLQRRDFRVTVITASAAAARHNGKHNTLVNNFHHAAGGDSL